MSDDPDFEMEVVENDELDELDASGASSSERNFRLEEEKSNNLGTEELEANKLSPESDHEEAASDKVAPTINPDVEGWSPISLGEFASFQNGNAFSKSDWKEDGYPIIRIQNLTGEADEYNYYEGDLEDRYRVDTGDTLLTWSGTIGVFKWKGPIAALNQHIFNVETSEEVNDSFFHFKLEELIPQLEALSHGSTMKHVRKADLVNIDVELPPLSEQRKIASVLYAVDQAIQKTEEIIERAKQVKSGLVGDLMTKGIGHNEYKEVKVPMLPEEWTLPEDWELKPLKELTSKITDGAHQTPTYVDEGIPFLKVEDIQSAEIDWTDVSRIPVEEHESLTKRSEPRRGDILLSKNGTIGITKIVDWDREFSHFVSLALIRPIEEKILPTYLSLILNSRICLHQAVVRSKTNTVTNLHLEEIKNFSIPLPPIDEQEEIAEVLNSAQERIDREVENKETLQRLKRGLMQDLLTGEIRTTEKAIEVLEEVQAHG